jgi:hypothetical protein
MIKVYFQTTDGSHSELVATFIDDELYNKCLPALEAEAYKQRCFVTESMIPEEISAMVADDNQAVEFHCLKWFPKDFKGSHEKMTDFFETYGDYISETINDLIEIHNKIKN